jgi:amino acid adenylation domain-containing protein
MIKSFNNSKIPVANSEQELSAEQLLTETELHKLLVEWNNTLFDYPNDKCIHELFEATVERTPDAVAVVFEGEQLTYRELNARANQLAHYLQSLGVEPEVLVGICIERSLEMVVGLLGILKAGGAYVPLDPAYPSERLAFMLEDSCVAVLLTKAPEAEKLTLPSERVVYLDKDWEEIAQHSEKNPAIRVTHNNLAYVIYTSGSTGKPKGVLVVHQGVCNLITAQMQLFNVQPNSRVLQFASFSFDASVWEVLMALVPGATLVMATRQNLLPGPALIGLLREQAVTTITLPPSVIAVLPEKEFPALQTIIVAGEACSSNLVARWASGRRLFNAYGPTEATVCATVALCTDGSQKPSIGRPIANTQIYLLDEKLQPVAIGVPGELYIGGAGLARGYLNRPDLTKEKFIPNPFSNKPGERLYKTGDLARYLSDGNIEYLGRIDNQVKIRGFRIELGEIEAVLAQHPEVFQALVICREDIPGNKHIVAYLVPKTEAEEKKAPPTVDDFRSFLLASLPDYMVPVTFIFLPAMPLTPNGKIDHRALPDPNTYSRSKKTDFVPPSTPTEKAIAAIWSEVLGIEVGIHDDFIQLGGQGASSFGRNTQTTR